jgi:preprotein translocase subunit YajC
MDIAMITELISTLGFPMACVIAMGFFIYKIYKKSEDREDKLMLEIEENRRINADAIATIGKYAGSIDEIKHDISEIKNDINVIKNQ